jgi:monofunctional biosynthetic peptidoglycan transglycosylase
MGRFLKWIALAILACLVLSVVVVLTLRWVDPPTSAFMLAARMNAMSEGDRGYRTEYDWVDLENISPHAAIAVVASEDQQFPFHAGFDLNSIRESVRASERGKKKHLRGASTISQQVAKNLFLWNGYSFIRKALEAYLTVIMELTWPKERILEVYLNIAEFGKGIYGVQAASERFFHKPASRLSSAEAATLAAVLPNPIKMHAERPSAYVSERREQILAQMRALGGASYLQALEKESHPVGKTAGRR